MSSSGAKGLITMPPSPLPNPHPHRPSPRHWYFNALTEHVYGTSHEATDLHGVRGCFILRPVHLTLSWTCLSSGKCNAVPLHSMKVYRWSKGIAPLILNPGNRWRWGVDFIPPGRFPPSPLPGKNTSSNWPGGCVGPKGGMAGFEEAKISLLQRRKYNNNILEVGGAGSSTTGN